jgi:small-conductance mechanosensitive channel
MPRPSLSVDWNVIRSLYLQGVPSKELAERFGVNVTTLRAKASKKGWNAIIGTEKERAKPITEKTAQIARDIWTERREAIRENIHTIGSRMTAYASQLPEDQLLAKADKVKIATEIAGKVVGLDRQEDKNVVNIALLGSYADSDTIEGSFQSVPTLHGTE